MIRFVYQEIVHTASFVSMISPTELLNRGVDIGASARCRRALTSNISIETQESNSTQWSHIRIADTTNRRVGITALLHAF
jgi:hypothetical protein